MILYQYGRNTQGTLVKIEDINENNSSDKYQCLSCNNPLRPRAIKSDKVRPHFYHPNSNNKNKCNPESYIHKLAKLLFLEHLKAKKPLSIHWEKKQECDNPFSNPRCIKKVKREVNLITQYPYYGLEKKILMVIFLTYYSVMIKMKNSILNLLIHTSQQKRKGSVVKK